MRTSRFALIVLLLALLAGGVVLVLRGHTAVREPPLPPADLRLAEFERTDEPISAESLSEARAEVLPPSIVEPAAAAGDLRVTGTVLDEHGELVPEVFLRWLDDSGAELDATVDRGLYSMDGLYAGHWIVVASGMGWRRAHFEVELDPRPLAQQRDFTIHSSHQVRIRLVGRDGTPWDGLGVEGTRLRDVLMARATRAAPGETLAPIVSSWSPTSEYGRFRGRGGLGPRTELPMDCIGMLELDHDAPLAVSLVSGTAVFATEVLEAIPDELVFPISIEEIRWRRAGLRAHLLQPDGRAPAENATVSLFNSQTTVNIRTSADGRAASEDLSPGLYNLTIWGADVSSLNREVVLAPGQFCDLGDVVLRPRQTLRVRFEFPDRKTRSVLYCLRAEASGDLLETMGAFDNIGAGTQAGSISERTWPGPGKYVLRVLSVGEHGRDASVHLGARPLRLALEAPPTDELVVPLVRTVDVCLRPALTSTRTSRWLISTTDGLPCLRASVQGMAPKRIQLPPGTYSIARIDEETQHLGPARAFTLGDEALALDLEH